MIRLKSCVIISNRHFPAFTQAIANIQYPFNNNVALINLNGNFESIWHCHLSSTSTDYMSPPTFSWTCAFVFIEVKWWLLLKCVRLSLRIYFGKRIKFSTIVRTIVPRKLFELRLTLAKTWGRHPLLDAQHSQAVRHQSLHQWFLPVSVCSTRIQAIQPSSEWKICSWTWIVATWNVMVSTESTSRRWA